MEKPTIVQLTEPSGISVATFEEAFGDHSEFKGRGRARKAERQKARQQRKATKKSAKQAKKQQRVESRLTRKATKVAARQDRKNAKVAGRMDRRAMRRPDEVEQDDMQDENSVAMQDTAAVNDQQYDQSTADDTTQGSAGEGTAESDDDASEPAYHDTNDEESQEENDEEYAEEEEGDDDYSDEDESGADGDPEDVRWGEENNNDPDASFNGATAFEFDSAEGQFKDEAMKQEANVSEIIQRQQANQALIQRILDKMKVIRDSMNRRLPDSQRMKCINDLKKFKEVLDMRKNRAVELQQQLEAFSEASGKRAAKQAARQEKKAVKQATKTARVAAKSDRKAIRQEAKTSKVAAKQERRAIKKAPVQEPSVTEVEQGLNADIEDNKIEVPAEETSGANGIELYAMGTKNEEFVPEDRIVEIKYGADGIGGNVRKFIRPSLVLGAAVLLTAYWVNKKYQWIKF